MKKRILFIMALGVSFAPLAFADGSSAKTGQESLKRTDMTGVLCPIMRAKLLAEAEAEGKATPADSQGSANSADKDLASNR